MEENANKKSFKSKLIDILIIIVILIISIFFYSKYVEPKSLIIKETRISSKDIPSSFSGVKLVYMSDLLLGSSINLDELESITNKVKELKPDILIYGGNLIYKDTNKKEDIISLLNSIDTSIGKYYVTGSLDKENSIDILDKSGFINLDNTSELLYYKGLTPICLYGISSYIKGNYKLEDLTNCKDYYTVFITHEPDVVSKLSNETTNLILAGNTLGGEINLPVISKKYDGSINYYKDYYSKENMYISTGIGSRSYHLRLFNKPSVNLFRLKSTGNK